jgi:hypothetical protein
MTDERARILTPAEVDIILRCPRCDAIESVSAKLATRLVIDQGSGAKLSLRARALPLSHSCVQERLGLE